MNDIHDFSAGFTCLLTFLNLFIFILLFFFNLFYLFIIIFFDKKIPGVEIG